MKYTELNKDQQILLKQNYLVELASDGIFVKTIYGINAGKERDPSYYEFVIADDLVSDDVIAKQDIDYVEEDFI